MDKTTPNEARAHRHHHRDLPRFWITLPEPVRRRALEHPLLAPLFPSHVGFFPRAKGHGIAREQGIDSTIFNYCIAGSGWCSVAGERHPVRPGDLMVIPAGEPHAYGTDPTQPWTLHWFHAMGRAVPLLLDHLCDDAASPVVHLGRSLELEALFDEVREALEDDYSEQSLLYASQVLGHLMGAMIRLRKAAPGDEPTAIDRTRQSLEHVRAHLAAPHDVAALASLAGLSPSHYSELVRTSTGYPPKEYLTRMRMHRAAQLLDTTDLPVKRIAHEVGFPDPFHFSRVFRRINEQSPAAYRRRTRSSKAP